MTGCKDSHAQQVDDGREFMDAGRQMEEVNMEAKIAMLKPDELPAPDTLIDYGEQGFGPLMWHYATDADRPTYIAQEQGFEHSHIEMQSELEEDDPLYVDYFERGASDVVARWMPPEREGWKLVGKNDTDDGPIAHYFRPLAPTPDGGKAP